MVVLRRVSSDRGAEGKARAGLVAAVSYDACRTIGSPGLFPAASWASGVGSGVVPLRTSRAISPMTIWPVRGANRMIKLMSFRGPPASSQGIQIA